MEIIKSWLKLYCCAIFFELCNGYSINLEDTVPEQHTQLLTGIIGVLLTVCSLVFIIGCLCCRRRNEFKVFQNSPVVECVTTEATDPGYTNPVVNGEFTIFTPLSPSHCNNNVFLEQSRKLNNFNGNGFLADIKNFFSDSEKDFPRAKLKYVEELGRGKYGKVVEGAAQCLDNNGEMWTPVVIRILDSSATDEERLEFLEDASFYKHGNHPNILSLVGRCFERIPLLLIQEYCQGDLKSYLSRITSETSTFDYTLLWCSQLSSALKFLHGYQIVHPDIASRNCQLNSSLNLKLGDYGLGMYKYPEDYYQNIPIRWCDPECLLFYENKLLKLNKLSNANNIWSLAITFWEMCECCQPFSNLTNEDVLQLLKLKHKLKKPSRNTEWINDMYKIMQMCWSDLQTRPQIVEIDMLISKLFRTYYDGLDKQQKSMVPSDDFDKKWEMLSPNGTQNMDANSDSILLEMGDDYVVSTSKQLSPSLNNLHGSLDNLLETSDKSHFLLNENVGNMFDSDSVSGPETEDNGSTDVLKRINSDSETEDENWREKVEKGTYTEKVRVKSKSITDLMVLTHIDYCESESETPFSSINYKVNSKPQRSLTAKSDVPYMPFGSEGNLLSIQDPIPDKIKVNDELKKFHEEYNCSQLTDSCTPKWNIVPEVNNVFETESNKLKEKVNTLYELNIQPQVYNLYNVTIGNLPYVNNKLSDYISFNHSSDPEMITVEKSHMFANSQLSNSNNRLRCDNSFSSTTMDDSIPVAKNESHVPLNFDEEIRNVAKIDKHLVYDEVKNESSNHQDSAINKISLEITNHLSCNDKSNVNSISSFVPFVLYKSIPTKIQFENFSIIILFDILIEPYNKKNLISTLMTWSNFIEKAIDINHNQESHVIDNSSGPKSIIFYNTVDTYIMKKQESLDEHPTSIDAWVGDKGHSANDREANNLNYSLETWDSFLEKALDEQTDHNDSFYNFSIEPKSMIFLNDEDIVSKVNENEQSSCKLTPSETTIENDDEKQDSLESGDEVENENSTNHENVDNIPLSNDESDVVDENREDSEVGNWERNEGWYLHPQIKEDLSGEMEIDSSSTESYVGFGIDDELVSAVRDELIRKLPHAQKTCLEQVEDDSEWESQERDEVFLRYNVYNTPLPPIPEESLYGDDSDLDTPKGQCEDDSDWSANCEPPQDTESHSSHTLEVPKHCHTLSESSCCSNDTLFNLEELNSAPNDGEKRTEQQQSSSMDKKGCIKNRINQEHAVGNSKEDIEEILNSTFVIESEADSRATAKNEADSRAIAKSEAEADSRAMAKSEAEADSRAIAKSEAEADSRAIAKSEAEADSRAIAKSEAGADSRLIAKSEADSRAIAEREAEADFDKCGVITTEFPRVQQDVRDFLFKERKHSDGLYENNTDRSSAEDSRDVSHDNQSSTKSNNENEVEPLDLEHIESTDREERFEEEAISEENFDKNDYKSVNIEYSQYVDMENAKNSLEYDGCKSDIDYINIIDGKNPNGDEDNIFDMLADIRFSGPTDSQLMSTSFSESNTCDEKEWDSGSDSRSSSSGEFIWKEGEREESLKALRTVHHDFQSEGVRTNEESESPFVESDISSSFSDDEDRETPEFVPSAWDKFALPIKSALRSPEKTLKKSENKKPKVWFKKQKYHCIYEYPKEPESPIFQKEVQWHNDLRTFQDWEFDNEPCLSELDDCDESSDYSRRSRGLSNSRNLYQLTDVSDFMSGMSGVDEKFFVSSSSRPFDVDSSSSSQFFPGNSNWINVENATPDSGVEDIVTPSTSIDNANLNALDRSFPSLKQLASEVIRKNKIIPSKSDEPLGGLRHTRNKLKLELPPVPSGFTVGKMFTLDDSCHQAPPMPRENPTFTTFGKSRFLVQHIDTPNERQNSNVSFEALPYQPLNPIVKESQPREVLAVGDDDKNHTPHTHTYKQINNVDKLKLGMETVKGEASLLDSADEDSGIESSTLEKKLNT